MKKVLNPGPRSAWSEGDYAILDGILRVHPDWTNAQIAASCARTFDRPVTENAIKGAKYRLVRRNYQSMSLEVKMNTFACTPEEVAAYRAADPALEHWGRDNMSDYWFKRFDDEDHLREWLAAHTEFDVDKAEWVTYQWDTDGGPNSEPIKVEEITEW